MAEIASAYVSLLPSLRGFGSRLNREAGPMLDRAGRDGGRRLSDGMARSVKGSVKSIFAPVAAGVAAIGVGAFFKDAIQGASDLNEAGTKTQAIFGKAGAALVEGFAGKGAKALGQTQLEVLNAASTFGTFGKAAGLTGKKLADFSTGFAGLSTDLASFFNTSPEEAVEAIGAALRGEAEPIRKYGVLLDDASLRQEALRQGLIKTTKQALTPQQKVLAAQALIYKQTKDAQGDFQKTSGGLANQQRILGARFKDLRSELGKKLLPTAVNVVSFINDRFLPAVTNFGKKAQAGFAEFKKAFTGGQDFKASSQIEKVAVAARKVSDVVKAALPSVKAFFGGLLKGDTGYAGPLEKFAVAGDKVRKAIAFAYDKVRDFGGWLKNNLWPAIKEGAEKIFPALGRAWDIITGGNGKGAKGAKVSFSDFGKIITDVVIPAVSTFVEKWLPYIATQIRIMIEALKAGWNAFITFRDIIAGALSFILRKFADVSSGFAVMLGALGKVPGFKWAADAAKKLNDAALKARGLAEKLDDIKSKDVTIGVKFKVNGSGQVTLANGVKVDVGQFKARARGGPVRSGTPYIVGEKRPELFVPNQSGRIIPRVPTGPATASSKSGVEQHFHGDIRPYDYADFERQAAARAARANLLGI